MATKTENEKKGGAQAPANGAAITVRTDTAMKFTPITDADIIIPDTLAGFLAEGFTVQRHCKMVPGTYVRGIFEGMEDGELARITIDPKTGEVLRPKIKWVYLRIGEAQTIRLLGAYKMVSDLERIPEGTEVIIARGVDYEAGQYGNVADYFVMPRTNAPKGAAGATVE